VRARRTTQGPLPSMPGGSTGAEPAIRRTRTLFPLARARELDRGWHRRL